MAAFMTARDAARVRVGDRLRINPAWNRGERAERRLPSLVVVEGIQSGRGQSGLLFRVRAPSGLFLSIDSGWFYNERS